MTLSGSTFFGFRSRYVAVPRFPVLTDQNQQAVFDSGFFPTDNFTLGFYHFREVYDRERNA